MSSQSADEVAEFDIAQLPQGEVALYEDRSSAALAHLPWVVAPRLTSVSRAKPIARFARQSHAVCFMLAYRASGWPSAELVREAARAVVLARYEGHLEERIDDLAAALGVVAPPPRVLIVVDRGIARAYATPGVLVAMADLDSQREFSPSELAPMHIEFGELLQRAGVSWPLSRWGRRQAAVVFTPGAAAQGHTS